MHKLSVKRIVLWGVLLVVCFLLAVRFFQTHILYTSDTLSVAYSRSVTSTPSSDTLNWFYVRDNVLYFTKDKGFDKTVICYVKNNWIHTFAEIPNNYQRFIVVDDETVIVEVSDIIYLLNVSDGKLTEKWQGDCVGYCRNQVYYTNGNALYAAEIAGSEQRKIVSYDELLAHYDDGIVYRDSKGIYWLFYEKSDAPQLITEGTIPWTDVTTSWLLDVEYVYTPDYALCIGSHSIDMYVYETGEIQRIYYADVGKMIIMAVTASENELYVSRQWVDMKFWPLKNKDINGTYKYDICEKEWTKITDKTYHEIVRFDEQYLYGYGTYGLFFPNFKCFKID